MKIILINTYPMDHAHALWEKGLYPGHHLWGILELKKDPQFEFIILRHEKYKWLNKLGKLLNIEFLDQQIRALRLLRKCDMIYAPYAAANTKLLLLFKFLKLIKKPIVIVVHQPLLGYKTTNTLKKRLIRRLIYEYDSIIFLSKRLRDDLIDTLEIPEEKSKNKIFHLDWGPDTDFYKHYATPKPAQETEFVISAGHTGRDFDTLVRAFSNINFPLKIYCTPASVPSIKDIPAHIEIIANEGHVSYFDLLGEYNKARIIAIPLSSAPQGTEGLTSILDVLGMGKPVIMTRNENVDLDIDKENIGMTVASGNVENWNASLTRLIGNPALLDEMGKKSRMLLDKTYNLKIFSEKLGNVFVSTLENYKSSNAN